MLLKKIYLNVLVFALCAFALGLPDTARAGQLTLLYVPLDDRPVCSAYSRQTMEAAGCRIILPPEKYIASGNRSGDPDALWHWLRTRAPKADAAVISMDSLLYGGLVASRTHGIPEEKLEQRLLQLHALSAALPVKIYAFSTIMRTPRASNGQVEPPYYSTLGPDIFTYSQLLDKQDQGKLNPAERLEMQALESSLPAAELNDWLERRRKNLHLNYKLTQMARSGKFHYLAIGKDDNAALSATHMEARRLSLSTFDMKPQLFQIIDGADQLGLLLLTRAYNEAHGQRPSVYPLYSPGAGASTLPQYSDSRLQDSVPQQITAAGAVQAAVPQSADLILALNSPQDGIVRDSTADDNQYFASPANKSFARTIRRQLNAGRSIALADISYSNGADNGFMKLLASDDTLSRLTAYSGWNTADNAVGYAIAQGIMAASMEEEDRSLLLRQRLIDDWFYQSNARRHLSAELERHNREELKYELGSAEKPVVDFINWECARLANDCPATRRSVFKISLPWQRLFEAHVKMKK